MDISAVEKFLNEFLEGGPHFLVEIRVEKGDHLEVYIDSYESFSHADCIKVTRALQDKFGPELNAFNITVSSAGLDRPFRSIRQYHKNLGRSVKIITCDGKAYTGLLESLTPEGVRLEVQDFNVQKKKPPKTEPQILFIPFSEIKQTTRLILFKKEK